MDDPALARPLRSRTLGAGAALQATPLEPYQGRQAAAYPLARLGFYARAEGFSLSRASALDDLEGGAVLQLGQGLGLTAAYRLLGAGIGVDALVPGAGGKALAAPFVAVVFDF